MLNLDSEREYSQLVKTMGGEVIHMPISMLVILDSILNRIAQNFLFTLWKRVRKYGSLVPFANKFPKNTKLYKLMTTKPGESA